MRTAPVVVKVFPDDAQLQHLPVSLANALAQSGKVAPLFTTLSVAR
jgi:hypothetical protein